MYSVHSEVKLKGVMDEILIHKSFMMGSSNKVHKIAGCNIKSIQVTGVSLASPMVTSIVMKKYHKLIDLLTQLLTDDDDTGDSIREALNQIEKFRQEIKNKYRDFLKKKELELMSKQLLILQKEATKRYLELHQSFIRKQENNRSK